MQDRETGAGSGDRREGDHPPVPAPGHEGESEGLVEDLKALPDEVRAMAREVDESMGETLRRNRRLDYMVDLITVGIAAGVAFLIALILVLIGLNVLIGIVVFVLLLGVLIVGVAEVRREPPSGEQLQEVREEGKADEEQRQAAPGP